MLANNLEDLGMHAIRVYKLTSKRRGMPAGPERENLSKEIRQAQDTLRKAIRSWRKRNEG
jgi:hypothetical protein